MPKYSSPSMKQYRLWSLLFLPCVVWGFMPPWHDVSLFTTFVISQVLMYSLQHVRGMLILSTLVLILWTKSLLSKWYRSQLLNAEFFKSLLYMAVTALVSVAAVFVVWMPLYEAYALAVYKLDKATAAMAMDWRNTIFLMAGVIIATIAVAQTDLVLRPSQVDNTGMAILLRKLSNVLYRVFRFLFRDVLSVWQAVRRCARSIYGESYPSDDSLVSYHKQRPRRGERSPDISDDDDEETNEEEVIEESQSPTVKSFRQTRSMDSIISRSEELRKVSSVDLPHCSSYNSPKPGSHSRRSMDRDTFVEAIASDIDSGLFEDQSCLSRSISVTSSFLGGSDIIISPRCSDGDVFVVPGRSHKTPSHHHSNARQNVSIPLPNPSNNSDMFDVPNRKPSRCLRNANTNIGVHLHYPSCDREMFMVESSPSLQNDSSRTPSRPRSKAKRNVSFSSDSDAAATSYHNTQRGPRTRYHWHEPNRNKSSVDDATLDLHQSFNSGLTTPSINNTTSNVLRRCVHPRRQTPTADDATSDLLQQCVRPHPNNTMSDVLRRCVHPRRQTPAADDTMSELLMQSVHPRYGTPSQSSRQNASLGSKTRSSWTNSSIENCPCDSFQCSTDPSNNSLTSSLTRSNGSLRSKTSSNQTNSSIKSRPLDSFQHNNSLTSSLTRSSESPRGKTSSNRTNSSIKSSSLNSFQRNPHPSDNSLTSSLTRSNGSLRSKTSSNRTNSSIKSSSLNSFQQSTDSSNDSLTSVTASLRRKTGSNWTNTSIDNSSLDSLEMISEPSKSNRTNVSASHSRKTVSNWTNTSIDSSSLDSVELISEPSKSNRTNVSASRSRKTGSNWTNTSTDNSSLDSLEMMSNPSDDNQTNLSASRSRKTGSHWTNSSIDSSCIDSLEMMSVPSNSNRTRVSASLRSKTGSNQTNTSINSSSHELISNPSTSSSLELSDPGSNGESYPHGSFQITVDPSGQGGWSSPTSITGQSKTSLNLSLADMLQRSVLPTHPRTRSQTNKVRQVAQSARKGRGSQADDSRIKPRVRRVKKAAQRWCPDCD